MTRGGLPPLSSLLVSIPAHNSCPSQRIGIYNQAQFQIAIFCSQGEERDCTMASKIESRILDRAIELFADYGYYGVTTRDLARKAKVTEGSIYRLFRSKKELFETAIKAASDRSLDPAQIALEVLNKLTAQNFSSLMTSIIHHWYFSLPRPAARLL